MVMLKSIYNNIEKIKIKVTKLKLIIFDEATSSLDFEAETKVLNTIYGLNRKIYTTIIISHKLNNLKRCDHVYKIQNSKLIKIR